MQETISGTTISDTTVAPGAPWWQRVEAGCVLRIVDLHGHQGVDFLCYNAEAPEERYHAPNTVKAAESILLNKGSVLYSDAARPLMTLIEDTCGGHDTIAGCCSAPSNEMLYGVRGVPGCRENFLTALQANGLGWRDIVPNINLFCDVPVGAAGKLAAGVFTEGHSVAGDFVDLRAEMPVLAVLSNCPQVNNPCNSGEPTEIRVLVYRPAEA
ncbi:MAG: DUF1989 domain-containing protein [Gammaproteobacteria bacterium]|nr:DUF1989 domain-containing protein [Gammaproteobacteria bacterium]